MSSLFGLFFPVFMINKDMEALTSDFTHADQQSVD